MVNKKFIVYTSYILLGLFLIVGFRTIRLWEDYVFHHKSNRKEAEKVIFNQIKKMLQSDPTSNFTPASGRLSDRELNDKVWDVIVKEQASFEKSVRELKDQFDESDEDRKSARSYLLESDSYYYYYITKRIVETGAPSDRFKPGFFYNPMRQTPRGTWDWFTLHPYLGAAWYHILHVFNHSIDLAVALCWFPVVLAVLCSILFFALCLRIGQSSFASFVSTLALTLCPMFVQRTSYGWFDTDVYIYIWTLTWMLGALKNRAFRKSDLAWSVLSGFWMGCLSLFWIGWQVVLVFCSIMLLTGAVLEWWNDRSKIPSRFWCWLILAGSALLTGMLLLNPQAFQALIERQISEATSITNDSSAGLWPNLFFFIGELASPTIRKIIFLNGGWFSWVFSLLGIVSVCFGMFKLSGVQDQDRKINRFALTTLLIGGIVLTFKSERFDHFLLIPLCILVGFGVDLFVGWINSDFVMNRLKMAKVYRNISINVSKLAVTIMVLITISPLTFASVSFTSSAARPILKATWEAGFQKLKEQSPKDSVVFSFWPPGYFVQAISERKTILDAGTPTAPENVWVAKAMMTDDERVTAGIFRMLAASGLDSYSYLVKHQYEPQDAVDLIMTLVGLPRLEADEKLKLKFSDHEREELLNLTHGKEPPRPGYVVIYDDLMKQNIMLSILAHWNLRKAGEIQRIAQTMNKKLTEGDMIKLMPDAIWPYVPEVPLFEERGHNLIFLNGLRVDLDAQQGFVADSGNPTKEQKIFSVVTIKNGEWTEVKAEKYDTYATAILYQDKDGIKGLVAHADLARSILFRLYYGRAIGLKILKPFYYVEKSGSRQPFGIFEINWDSVL